MERKFSEAMRAGEDIKLFFKLPDWFKVETPIGTYNPAWAIVKQLPGEAEKLHLIRETKRTKDKDELRDVEYDKIRCGEAHLKVLEVNFEYVTSAEEVYGVSER